MKLKSKGIRVTCAHQLKGQKIALWVNEEGHRNSPTLFPGIHSYAAFYHSTGPNAMFSMSNSNDVLKDELWGQSQLCVCPLGAQWDTSEIQTPTAACWSRKYMRTTKGQNKRNKLTCHFVYVTPFRNKHTWLTALNNCNIQYIAFCSLQINMI